MSHMRAGRAFFLKTGTQTMLSRLCTNYARSQPRLITTLQQRYASSGNPVTDMTDRGLVANITRFFFQHLSKSQ